MPDYTQFGNDSDGKFRLSANFVFPDEVGDNQTNKEAVEEWFNSMSDEELGVYIREHSVVEPW